MHAMRNLPTFSIAIVPAIICLLLAACSVPSPYVRRNPPTQTEQSTQSSQPSVQTQPNPVSPSTAPAEPLPTPTPRPRTLSPASKALVAQAQTQLNAGNDALAAATIERALRIEPNNPLLWIELAKIRQTVGNAPQAENLARKALAMAVGDGRAQAAAWRVIADTFRARGRNNDAREAEARALALASS